MKTQGFEPALLRERLAILGRSGQGKSNAAKTGVEKLLSMGGRVLVLDPTDVWHGLRLTREKKPAFDVAIFGGRYADLPLNPRAGATIGEAIARGNTSCIVSLRDLDEDELPAFAADLFSALYLHNRAPLTMVVDEADLFAPEQPADRAQHRSRKNLRRIIKQGRVDGFRPWLITQRPQELDKAALSQSDAMVAFSLTSSHDRDAVKSWIKGQAEAKRGQEFIDRLPQLAKGSALVWWPGGKVLEERHFPLAETFDTGKAPAEGKTRSRLNLKPIDVAKLGADMAAFVAERDAKDPAKLQARIAELERAAARPAAANPADVEAAHDKGFKAGRMAGYEAAMKYAGESMLGMTNYLNEKVAEHRATMAETARSYIAVSRDPPKPDKRAAMREKVAAFAGPPVNALMAATGRRDAPAVLYDAGDKAAALGAGEAKLLRVLAQHSGQAVDPVRLGLIAGFSSSGGTFQVYMRKLRAIGYVERSGDGWTITQAGLDQVGDFDPLPTGPELLRHWLGRLERGPGAILSAVNAAPGQELSAEDAGNVAGYAASGGTFQVYVRKLRALQLIEGRGTLKLHESLR